MSSLGKALKKASKFSLVLRPSLLLCPNIPKPLHGVAPRELLGSKWWNETRQAAYVSTAYHCSACGVWKSVPLCHYCHNFIHDGRMRALIQQRKFKFAKYTAVIQHGNAVLKRVGLEKVPYAKREEAIVELALNGRLAEWPTWRLVLFGKKYKPKFKTEEQWRKAMTK